MSIAAKLIIDFIAEDSDKSDYKNLEDFMVNKLSAWDKRSANEILESDLHINRLREDLLTAKEAKQHSIKGLVPKIDRQIVTIPADNFKMAKQAAAFFDLNEYL